MTRMHKIEFVTPTDMKVVATVHVRDAGGKEFIEAAAMREHVMRVRDEFVIARWIDER